MTMRRRLYLVVSSDRRGQHGKNLMVEDNDMNREPYLAACSAKAMKSSGSRCSRAWPGVGHPDLILMDLSLPEMDGWEAHGAEGTSHGVYPPHCAELHAMAGDREEPWRPVVMTLTPNRSTSNDYWPRSDILLQSTRP